MIHPQEQKWDFLCNHTKIKIPCQLSLSFLNDCAVYRSAGLHEYLLAANNSLPCFWLSPAAQICKCMLLPIWKISYCICTYQHSSRLYKICEICVPAYLWALSPQASEYFYRIQNTDKNATVCLCRGSKKHFWLCTNSLIGQDCFFFLLFFAHSRKGAVAVDTLRWSHSTNNYS